MVRATLVARWRQTKVRRPTEDTPEDMEVKSFRLKYSEAEMEYLPRLIHQREKLPKPIPMQKCKGTKRQARRRLNLAENT